MNGAMAIPNLIGLLLLSGVVARETKAYLQDRRGEPQPVPSSEWTATAEQSSREG
jgi:AGCS family alanine or glycine:cation symporter